jgi:hypothetical protein
VEQYEWHPRAMSGGLDGWPDSRHALVSSDGWDDLNSNSGLASCCVRGATSCDEASMSSGRCGGNWTAMVKERLFDFFNGTAGVDVDFTHPVILQGNLPFDRDDEWRARGYEAVTASPFDPKHIRSTAATCENPTGLRSDVCLTHAGKIRYGSAGRSSTSNTGEYPGGRLKLFDDLYSDVRLDSIGAQRGLEDRAADTAFQTVCNADGTEVHTCTPDVHGRSCCATAAASTNDDDDFPMPVNPRRAEDMLQQQRRDERRRFYSQSLFNRRLTDILHGATAPVFVLIATPALHPPLDSEHTHRFRAYSVRRAAYRREARCPWMQSWVGDSLDSNRWSYGAGSFCSSQKRDQRFEREAMAVAVDDGVGAAVGVLHARGMWNSTLMIWHSDNGGVSAAGVPNQPLRGSKSTWLEGGVHVRAALGGGYIPSELHNLWLNVVMSETDWCETPVDPLSSLRSSTPRPLSAQAHLALSPLKHTSPSLRSSTPRPLSAQAHLALSLSGCLPMAVVPAACRCPMLCHCSHHRYPTLSYLAGVDEYDDPLLRVARGRQRISAAAQVGWADQTAVAFPVDGRNAAVSWRRLYEGVMVEGAAAASNVEHNEFVNEGIADWCDATSTRNSWPGGAARAGCVPGIRVVQHNARDRTGGYVFTVVTRSKAWKVYAGGPSRGMVGEEGACPNSVYAGCPWSSHHYGYYWSASNPIQPFDWRRNCPMSVVVNGSRGACTIGGVVHGVQYVGGSAPKGSRGAWPGTVWNPDSIHPYDAGGASRGNQPGCALDVPCAFVVASASTAEDDPAEQSYVNTNGALRDVHPEWARGSMLQRILASMVNERSMDDQYFYETAVRSTAPRQ